MESKSTSQAISGPAQQLVLNDSANKALEKQQSPSKAVSAIWRLPRQCNSIFSAISNFGALNFKEIKIQQIIGIYLENKLICSTTNNIIRGHQGDDLINGGDGNYKIKRGQGKDKFILSPGKDQILDYKLGRPFVIHSKKLTAIFAYNNWGTTWELISPQALIRCSWIQTCLYSKTLMPIHSQTRHIRFQRQRSRSNRTQWWWPNQTWRSSTFWFAFSKGRLW